MMRKEGKRKMQAGVIWDKKLMEIVNNEYVPNRFFLDHAIERRKKEIRWVWFYLPFIPFAFIGIYVSYGALVWHIPRYTYLAFILLPTLAISFRFSFYQEYLRQCDRLMLTVAELLAKMGEGGGTSSETAGTRADREEIAGKPESAGSLEEGKPTVIQNHTTDLHDPAPDIQNLKPDLQDGPVLQGGRVPGMYYFGDELLPLFAEAGNDLQKGRIKTFLLDQLVRHECGRPSVFDKPASHIYHSVRIPGCNNKNIVSQYYEYQSRESIKLTTMNSLSTHKKYLRILRDFYQKSGDLVLRDRAKHLSSFLDSEKYLGKM